MGFGQILREAREAKGYTVEQLAEMTHIMARTLRGLEAEDFSSIVAPIYGRGFVKLCCQHLSLDPKPMVEEFMAIYNGEKPASAPAAATPAPQAQTPPEPVAEPEPTEEPLPEPDPVAEPTPVPEPESVAEPVVENPPVFPEPPMRNPLRADEPVAPATEPAGAPYGDLFDQPQAEPEPAPRKASVGRFAPPRPQDDPDDRKLISLPELPWRLIVLAVGAILVLWALFAGCRAIYRALSAPDDGAARNEPVQTVEPARPADPVPSETPSAKPPRTPKPVKPLYID